MINNLNFEIFYMPTVEPIKPGRPGFPTPEPTPEPTDETTGEPISSNWIDVNNPSEETTQPVEETKEEIKEETKEEIKSPTSEEIAQEKVIKAAKAIDYLMKTSVENKFPSLKESFKYTLKKLFLKRSKIQKEKSEYSYLLNQKVYEDFLK